MKIKATITKKLYYKDGWGIFGCTVDEKYKDKIQLNEYGNFTIKGSTLELVEGETYTMELGELIFETKNSKTYTHYPIVQVDIPRNTSSSAQYEFLKTQMSEKAYKSLCKEYPPSKKIKILDKIYEGEIDLTKIKGIGKKTAKKLLEKIEMNEELLYLFNKLSPLGVTHHSIQKIASHYKSVHTAIIKINESIYNLCEIKGFGFKKVDEYALRAGEDKEGFKRIEACMNYLIHNEASNGHCWTDINEITKEAIDLLNVDKSIIQDFFIDLDNHESNIIVINNNQVTSRFYYNHELWTFNNLKRINEKYKFKTNISELEKYIKEIENNLNIKYTEEQKETILESFQHGVFTINGKGGTGKTTILKGITEICNKLNLSYKAVALSGRATQILNEKGIESATIHRTLGYDGKEFTFNYKCQLDYDVIILDEASMVNASLWHSLTQAVQDGAKFIIVGDSGQLSGIGHGDVLRDLLQTKYFKGKELTQIHRQAQDSGIIEVASKIRDGEQLTNYNQQAKQSYGVNSDLFLITYNENQNLYNDTKNVIKSRMEVLTENNIMNFQVLVSNKERGELSTVKINQYCQSIYNDLNKDFISSRYYDFRIGDKVIISGNKYNIPMYKTIEDYHSNNPITELTINEYGEKVEEIVPHNLFNGTLGIVVDMIKSKEEESLLIKFEGMEGYIRLYKDQLKDLDLAYAITVHRSQGMGIENVLFLLDFSAYTLLSKQLVYTAITRASKKCVVMALNNALYKAIKTDASNNRRTFLKQLMQQELSNQN